MAWEFVAGKGGHVGKMKEPPFDVHGPVSRNMQYHVVWARVCCGQHVCWEDQELPGVGQLTLDIDDDT